MGAKPQNNQTNTEIEEELTRRLDVAKHENKPAMVEIAGNLYRLVPVNTMTVSAEDVQAAKDTLRTHFGSVTPHRRPENFAALREEFERGVAEDARRRGYQ